MIVDHLPKINVNRPESTNQHRHRSLLKGLGQLGLILLVAGILCNSSSAQQSTNSNKATNKATKDQKKESPKPKRIKRIKRFEALGRFEGKEITESSGVETARPAADGTASNAIWTLNDSGGEPMLFRVSINAADKKNKGRTEATLKLKGVSNRDWETMCGFAISENRFLAVGDVGDNLFRHKSYQIYVVPEPIVTPEFSRKGKLKIRELKSKVATIDFKYDDGPHNCEAMAYNSDDGTFWFVEKVYVDDKRKTAPGVYVLPNPMLVSPGSEKEKPKNVAKRIGDFPVRNVTGMAFSPDNQRLVIRTYFGAWLYEKTDSENSWQETIADTKAKTLTLPLQSQGEAICFAANGQSLLVTSEFKNAIIWQVRLDDANKDNNATEK